MFRRSSELTDVHDERSDYSSQDDFFGNEDATTQAAGLVALGERLTHVEAQITSQYTSLAAYSQIAQEQIELVRAEARHENERNTTRVIALLDQERADRLAAPTTDGLDERLDAIETKITELTSMLEQCLASQSALVDAVASLVTEPGTESPAAPLTAPPVGQRPLTEPPSRTGRVHLALA